MSAVEAHYSNPKSLTFRFLRWAALISGVIILTGSIPSASAQRQRPSSYRDSRTTTLERVSEAAKSDITFSRIDPVGNRCVMIYGSLSLGGDDFLIQDCGGSTWEKKGAISIGYINRMFFQNQSKCGQQLYSPLCFCPLV